MHLLNIYWTDEWMIQNVMGEVQGSTGKYSRGSNQIVKE